MSRALLLAAIFAGTAQSAPAWCESPSAFVEQSALCAERDDETYDLDFLTDAPATWCEHRNIQSTFSLPFDDPSLPCWEDDDGNVRVGTSCMPLPFAGIAPSCDGDGDDSQCTQISDGALVGGSSESTLALTTATGQVVIVDLNAISDDAFGDVVRLSAFLGDFFDHSQLHTNRGPWVHRLGESTFIDAIVQQNGSLFGFNKQTRCLAQNVVSVRHPPFKHGAFQTRFVDMGVKVVP